MRKRVLLTLVLLLAACTPGGGAGVPERITFPVQDGARSVQAWADLWLPPGPGPHPVMILVHGSGGRFAAREAYYRDALLPLGVGVAATDHFGPRGVRSTVEQQDLVPTESFVADLRALRAALDANPRVDAARIGAAGFSKGGGTLIALETRHPDTQAARQYPFAVLVPVYPPCNTLPLRPASHAPMRMLLGGADTYTPPGPCIDLASRMRAYGSDVQTHVFDGAAHGFDAEGGPWSNARGENFGACIFDQQPNRQWIERTTGQPSTVPWSEDVRTAPWRACMKLGVSGGGDWRARRDTRDLLVAYARQFLLGRPGS
jgi:dienelactone hydrolase